MSSWLGFLGARVHLQTRGQRHQSRELVSELEVSTQKAKRDMDKEPHKGRDHIVPSPLGPQQPLSATHRIGSNIDGRGQEGRRDGGRRRGGIGKHRGKGEGRRDNLGDKSPDRSSSSRSRVQGWKRDSN